MKTITCERVIAKPRTEVFAAFTDLESAPDRIQGIDSLEVLTDGPMQVGTEFRETRTMFGKEATETMTITDFEQDRGYSTFAESCGAQYRASYTFEDVDGGTLVRFTFDGKPVTFMGKIMSPVMGLVFGRMMKRLLAQDMDDMVAAIEKS